MGFGGGLIKEGLVLVISIVTLQNYFSDLCEMCGKYAGWVKVPGHLDIWPFFTQLPIQFTYIDIYGFWGAPYKRGSNFSYIDCCTPNCFGDLGEMCGKYAAWVKVPGPLDIWPFLTKLHILFTYIDIYRFWRSRYKRGSNLSYHVCYTPTLSWRPRREVWQVRKNGESTWTSWYLTIFHPAPYYFLHILIYMGFGGPLIKEGLLLVF